MTARCRAAMTARARAVAACVLAAFAFAPGTAAGGAWKQDRFLVGGYGAGADTDTTRLVRLAAAGIDFVVNADWWASGSAVSIARNLERLRMTHADFALRLLAVSKADPASERGEYRTLLGDCGGAERRSLAGDVSDNVHPDAARVRPALRAAIAPGAPLASPVVLGWALADEPVLPAALDRAFWADTVVAAAGRGLPFVNLAPPYVAEDAAPCVREAYRARYGSAREAAYRAHLEDWLARFDALPDPAPVLCVDHYPFEDPARERHDLLFTLRTMADAARRHARAGRAVPLWFVAQLSPRIVDGAEAATPSPAQCAYPAWAALAHGAKAVLWWTLVPMPPYGAGVLDARGGPAPRYAAIRALDARLHRAGDALFGCEAVAVCVADTLRDEGIADERAGRFPGLVRALEGPSARALLAGHLRARDKGFDWLLVVDRDPAAPASGHVRLAARPARIERFNLATGRFARVPIVAGGFDVPPVSPGDAALYRLVPAARPLTPR